MLLHRVGRDTQGPIDSVSADAGSADSPSDFAPIPRRLYLLSARFGGIEYFSSPVHTNPDRPDTAIRLMVYDTSTSVPISISARHIVVPRPGEDGAREVLDLLVLRNNGTLARVAPDSASGSWSVVLPAGSVGLAIGESDLSPDAVTRRGDSALILAPIAPGDKQLTLQYAIPRDKLLAEFPVGHRRAGERAARRDARRKWWVERWRSPTASSSRAGGFIGGPGGSIRGRC